MQVGGYDWTQTEQREWGDEWEREHREEKLNMPKHLEYISIQQACVSMRDYQAKRNDSKMKQQAFELAFEDPLYKVVFTPVICTSIGATIAYRVEWKAQPLAQEGPRNLVFEVVHPLYKGLKAIVASHGPFMARATTLRLHVAASEHPGVSYTCYCTPETLSYTILDNTWERLNKQLSMKQDLTRGLLLRLSFLPKR